MRALLAAVVLGGVFGSASATVESMDDEIMVVEVEVEVLGSVESVVAHLSFQDEPILTLPLLDRGGGTYGLRTELEPKNYMVVFEAIGADPQRSDPVSLTRMGADLGPSSAGTATTLGDEELSDESRQFLWLAVALGAASLSLLAFWVLGSRDDDAAAEDTPEADEPVADEG